MLGISSWAFYKLHLPKTEIVTPSQGLMPPLLFLIISKWHLHWFVTQGSYLRVLIWMIFSWFHTSATHQCPKSVYSSKPISRILGQGTTVFCFIITQPSDLSSHLWPWLFFTPNPFSSMSSETKPTISLLWPKTLQFVLIWLHNLAHLTVLPLSFVSLRALQPSHAIFFPVSKTHPTSSPSTTDFCISTWHSLLLFFAG